jgi:hypothetical protein
MDKIDNHVKNIDDDIENLAALFNNKLYKEKVIKNTY